MPYNIVVVVCERERKRETVRVRFSNQQVLLDVEFIQRLKSTVNDSQQAKVVMYNNNNKNPVFLLQHHFHTQKPFDFLSYRVKSIKERKWQEKLCLI